MLLIFTRSLSTGKGLMCTINRSSIFVLLFIQISLCDLTRNLYVTITDKHKNKAQTKIGMVLSMGLPCLLLAISYRGLFEIMYACSVAYITIVSWNTHVNQQLKMIIRQPTTINLMWRGMHFRARWGLVSFHHIRWCSCMSSMPWSYPILRYIICFLILSGFPRWVLNGVIFAVPFF